MSQYCCTTSSKQSLTTNEQRLHQEIAKIAKPQFDQALKDFDAVFPKEIKDDFCQKLAQYVLKFRGYADPSAFQFPAPSSITKEQLININKNISDSTVQKMLMERYDCLPHIRSLYLNATPGYPDHKTSYQCGLNFRNLFSKVINFDSFLTFDA